MLKRLDEAARSDANMVPVFIECVESYLTIGEICDVLRGVFGEQRESVVI
jgi:methylmalonyl-CoA mutase N-terminal domain/subunit